MTGAAGGGSKPLVAKLEHGADLTEADRAVLDGLIDQPWQVAARRDLICEGDRPNDVLLILEGFACRYKVLPDGSRQNVAFLVPGDFCDLHVAILDVMDHGIAALSPCSLVSIPRATILDLTDKHPRIARALWWCCLVDEGILREWLVNLGRREADHRMAHLFGELLVRLRTVGLADPNGYAFPLTQDELADTLGITPVHVSRTLQRLREMDLVDLRNKRLTIPDPARLMAFCEFDPTYLHLTKRRGVSAGP